MEIAKGIYAKDYKDLNLANYSNQDWDCAFDFLDRRLTERYLEPIEVLQNEEKDKSPIDKKFGFTILAIDCLLIETIQSFYQGVTDSTGHSKKLFKNFLRNRESFIPHFQNDSDAEDFYRNFRCGILHQAQTFKNTKVWVVGELISKNGNTVTVNRDLFHEAVKTEKDIYINSLYKRIDLKLLKNFKKKMDFITSF